MPNLIQRALVAYDRRERKRVADARRRFRRQWGCWPDEVVEVQDRNYLYRHEGLRMRAEWNGYMDRWMWWLYQDLPGGYLPSMFRVSTPADLGERIRALRAALGEGDDDE